MSSRTCARSRAFEPRASRRFAVLLVAAHAAAVAAALAAQVPAFVKPPLVAALAGSAARALRVHAWRSHRAAVTRIEVREDGSWLLQARDGTTMVGALHDSSYIHPSLVVVGVRDGWRTRFVPVAADALDPDAHRRLRVLVKWSP